MMVSPWMNEELTMLQDSVARLLQKEFVPQRERWEDECRVDRKSWRLAGEMGLLGASLPEQYGGGGGGLAHDIVIQQEFERAGLGGGFGIGIGVSSMVAHYILAYGSEVQRQNWLPRIATGELIGAIAMSEPGTGSDLQGIRTRAVKVDGGYRISGQKTFISNGQNADLIVAVCQTGDDKGKGISLIVVESTAEGFRRGRNLKKVGMPAQDTSELFFDDVFVPDSHLLGGQAGNGFKQLVEQLAWERMLCALGGVMGIEMAVEHTVAYVKERKAFGKAVMDFQNTQFKLAECKTLAVVARTFFDQLVPQLLAGTLDPATAAMAKWWTTDTQGKVIDECLQLHGGYGYMTEYPIARMWRDARVMRIFAGTNEIMKVIIARTL
ncbi:MAG: acyl-CoA dehydrogenase domain protein [Polaromonas sp.]|nr:acyl-CoA dehydrogenase domain protein [Polaromonas sp.]